MNPESEVKNTRQKFSSSIIHSKLGEKLIVVSKQKVKDLKELKKLMTIKPLISPLRINAFGLKNGKLKVKLSNSRQKKTFLNLNCITVSYLVFSSDY